jgi:hypothetical protein
MVIFGAGLCASDGWAETASQQAVQAAANFVGVKFIETSARHQ